MGSAFAFVGGKKIRPTVLHARIRIALKLAGGQQLSTFDISTKTQTSAENFVCLNIYKLQYLCIYSLQYSNAFIRNKISLDNSETIRETTFYFNMRINMRQIN